MSRSCQSGTFSKPATALPRSTRARPLMRSQVIGIALVRHRRRALLTARERLGRLAHLAALQVAHLGREAVERAAEDRQRRQQLGVAVARRRPAWRRPRGRDRARRARAPRRAGRRCRRRRRRPRACRRRRRRTRARRAPGRARSSYHQPSSLSPNVVGSACTPWVRPMQGVARCSSARSSTAASARSQPASSSAPAARSCRASPVSTTSEDVSP